MADFSTLALEADSRGLLKGVDALDKVVEHGARAADAADKVAERFRQTEAAANQTTAPVRRATDAMTGTAGAAKRATDDLERMTRATGRVRDANGRFIPAAKRVTDEITDIGRASGRATGILDRMGASIRGGATRAFEAIRSTLRSTVGAMVALTAASVGVGAVVTTLASFDQAMSTVAPISASLGIGIADTAAAIGLLSDAGVQGERAGTALRGVMASLAGPTTQAAEALAALGLSVQDVNPAANSMDVIFGRLRAAGMSTADAMAIFGREAATGAIILSDGSQRLGDFGHELGNVAGEAARMAEVMRDTLRGDLDNLSSAAEGLILAIGDAGLTAVIRGAVQSLTAFVSMISANVEPVLAAFGVAVDLVGVAMAGLTSHCRRGNPAVLSPSLGDGSSTEVAEMKLGKKCDRRKKVHAEE